MASFQHFRFSLLSLLLTWIVTLQLFPNNVFVFVVDARKDRNAPHPFPSTLKAYEPGPFASLKLSKDDEAKLKTGKPVMKQTDDGDGGGGAICVQDVHAPKTAVWGQILDLEAYKGKVPKVNDVKNYAVKKNPNGTMTIKTKMVLGVLPGYSYTSFYDHTLHAQKDSLTWKLDYDKTSDFEDVSGHWHVEDHPTTPNMSRVFYACDIQLNASLPKPIVNYLSKSALVAATSWVKKNSEKLPNLPIPSAFQSLFGVTTTATTSKAGK